MPVPGKCCGQCVQTKCIVNENVYDIGEKWKDPNDNCTEFSCESRNNQPVISGVQETCPDVSQCAEHLKYKDGCCMKCQLEAVSLSNCLPETLAEQVTVGYIKFNDSTHGTCTNTMPVRGISQCGGTCNSGTTFSFDTLTQKKYCKCCSPAQTKELPVELLCEDNFKYIHEIPVPISCSCSACQSDRETKVLKGIQASA